MIVTIVSIEVKPENLQEFIEASIENHLHSIKEPLNLRFDILQSTNNPSCFTFYEAYETEEGVAAHKLTPHYLKWRSTVEAWMANPRQGKPHKVISPKDIEQWR
ncbi:MAG: antibiotic biosynthesis monooxygenase [Bacteroidetes bacterium RIFOXYA12_FULL_35_11]|nr:MAG: antibiotic biosynthesis monooxygenase [Bacteroidetes bacterium GWF2_35_48]OFY80275.1 MAG: antibiotic biosynthesis monooxygenase [Bacteroidetes bacterium RIFOXYA12_FULL_35_11]OFZ01582.1 MAG: antibiotic biosynthesis monooxygenase [Bacteroidetes bacterium RIFOXYC12_FULL_35_7]HBX50450.1 antibiotic biosynthesis monooxygenase [Bacteroidales bacterium]